MYEIVLFFMEGMAVVDWDECIDRYETSFFNFGYDIKASYDKDVPYHWGGIILKYERDNVSYEYKFYTSLPEFLKQQVAEHFILAFNPDEVPPKREEFELETYKDGAIIKGVGDNPAIIRLDGKRNSFIRVEYNKRCEIINMLFSKKIKLKTLPIEEHIAKGIEERNNFNLYIPEIEARFENYQSVDDIVFNIDRYSEIQKKAIRQTVYKHLMDGFMQ